jgi:hypothetical protein
MLEKPCILLSLLAKHFPETFVSFSYATAMIGVNEVQHPADETTNLATSLNSLPATR